MNLENTLHKEMQVNRDLKDPFSNIALQALKSTICWITV